MDSRKYRIAIDIAQGDETYPGSTIKEYVTFKLDRAYIVFDRFKQEIKDGKIKYELLQEESYYVTLKEWKEGEYEDISSCYLK